MRDWCGQAPAFPRGEQRRSPLEKIRRWWKKYPNANIGIRTGAVSNRVVIDLDNKDGKSGSPAEFSPDAHWLYFQTDRTGQMQIWRMHPNGTAQEQLLVSDTCDWFPHISPDGKMIAFLAYKPGTQDHPANQDAEIRVLSLSDKKLRTLAKLLGGRGTMDVPSWSPDSKMLAFTSYELLPQ